MSKDPLGDRMKAHEAVTQSRLPRRTYTLLRLDGKAFHSFTRSTGMERPFDQRMVDQMTHTTRELVSNISGCVLGYTQSDEISLLLTDFKSIQTQPWLGGSLQKIVSISASMATGYFNSGPHTFGKVAFFDSRAYTIPDPVEVANAFIWRQKDCTRNSVSMAAQSVFSHTQLQGKSTTEMVTMLDEAGKPWNELPSEVKNGVVVYREVEVSPVTYVDKRTNETVTLDAVERSVVKDGPAPLFTKTTFLRDLIPTYGGVEQSDILQRAK